MMSDQLLENPLFSITFFGGLIFILAGFVQLKFPPKKINSLYGYRTSASMKNQERWDFAQKFSTKEMIKSGVFLMLTSFLAVVTNFINSINLIIGLSSMLIAVTILFVKVEMTIKRKFNN